nr:ribosome biogenesis protein BRX1 [Cryptomonas sp.]
MDKNVEKFRNIFLFNKYPKTTIFIAINPKICTKTKNLAKDLFNIIPNSKLIYNAKKRNFSIEMKYISKSNENNLSIFFNSIKSKIDQILISSHFYDVTYLFSIYNFKSCADFCFFGNCSKWSKPIIVFDKYFDDKPHLAILKNIFVEIFTSKSKGKLSEPLVDHVISFVYVNSKVWLRVYQVKYIKNLGLDDSKREEEVIFLEIGPRVSLIPIKAWSNLKKKQVIFDFTDRCPSGQK